MGHLLADRPRIHKYMSSRRGLNFTTCMHFGFKLPRVLTTILMQPFPIALNIYAAAYCETRKSSAALMTLEKGEKKSTEAKHLAPTREY